MGDLSPDVTDNALQVGSCNYSITLLVTFNPLVMGVVIFMQYGIMQIMHYLACAAGGIVYCVIKVLAAEPRSKKKEWGRGV